jgi:hypothetical protein
VLLGYEEITVAKWKFQVIFVIRILIEFFLKKLATCQLHKKIWMSEGVTSGLLGVIFNF